MKIINLTVILFTSILVYSCSSDSDANKQSVPDGVYGTWGGDHTTSTGNKRTLIVTFYSNMSGDITYESNAYYRMGYFTYTFEGNIIACTGVMAGEDGNVDENWTQSFEYHNDHIIPIGAYSDITLYPEWYNDNSGGNSSNSGTSGGTSNSTFHVGFTNDWTSLYSKGTYTHQIFMDFGVSKGTYALGYTSFGVAVRTPDGTVENASAKTKKVNGVNMKCFEEALYSGDKDYEWGDLLIVSSKNKTVTLEYVPYFYDNNAREYVYMNKQTYTYTPKEITNY